MPVLKSKYSLGLQGMRLLLIEDDPLIGKATRRYLISEEYAVDWVQTAEEALTSIRTHTYSAILLDLGLPDMDGQVLLTKLRSKGITVPILIITARDSLSDRVLNLDNGADDFIIKPYDLEEVTARLRVSLRRAQGRAEDQIKVGEITLYPRQKRVLLLEQEVPLTGREFMVLSALMGAKGQILSRAQIEEALYGWGEEVESNSLEVHVHNLRKKLGKKCIETVHGLGYRIAKGQNS